MAAQGGALARLDVPVFLPAAEVHLGLRLPFRAAADNRPDAESWWDADRGAAPRVCFDKVDAIPEDRRGHLGRPAVAAGILAGLALHPEDAVPDRLVPASALFPERPASIALVGRWAQLHAAAALCIQDAGQSAA
jgi:hypothetical protein